MLAILFGISSALFKMCVERAPFLLTFDEMGELQISIGAEHVRERQRPFLRWSV